MSALGVLQEDEVALAHSPRWGLDSPTPELPISTVFSLNVLSDPVPHGPPGLPPASPRGPSPPPPPRGRQRTPRREGAETVEVSRRSLQVLLIGLSLL